MSKSEASPSIEDLHEKTGVSMIKDRLFKMNLMYFTSNIAAQNQLVIEMLRDYVEFKNKPVSKGKLSGDTVLCRELTVRIFFQMKMLCY